MAHSETGKQVQKPIWEYLFVVFVLFLSTGAVFSLFIESRVIIYPIEGNLVKLLLWPGIYGVTLFLLVSRRNLLQGVVKDKPILTLMGLSIVSIIWSALPLATIVGDIALLGTSLFGVYLAVSFTRQELLEMLLWALGISAVLSIIATIMMPEYAFDYEGGHLRGIYANKNHLGPMMCLGALTWLIYAMGYKRLNPAGFLFCAVYITLLYFSGSATAIIMFIVLLALLMVFSLVQRPFFRTIPVMLIVFFTSGMVFLFISNNIEALLAVMGKNITFTGRTELWQIAGDMIQQQPWLGYGYNAFWLGYEGPSRYIWHCLNWTPPNAHNGYLDICLQLGLVGLAVFMVSLVRNCYRAFIHAYRGSGWVALFPLLFLVFLIIHNLTETTLMVRNSIQWILYVVITMQLGGEWAKQRRVRTVVRANNNP